MLSLDQIEKKIQDEIRIEPDGKGFASISGTARLADVKKQTLSEAFGNPKSKLSQILAQHGFDPVSFSRDGVPDIAVALTISYYANRAGDRCTEQARLVNDVLLAVGVRSWMQKVKGWTPQQEEQKLKQIWVTARIEGKATRRSFTDAVMDYIDRHRHEMSENAIKFMYINASDQVNLVVFGRKSKRLAEDLQIPKDVLRDNMTSDELQLLREVENTSIRMIDRLDMNPIEAVKLAGVNLLIPKQDRKVVSLPEAG